MTLIVCLDDKNGMLFNKRRQSKDSVLCQKIAELAGAYLCVNAYTAKLFPGVEACSDPLVYAGDEDVCFVEDLDVTPYLEKANRLIVYRWNRLYPADVWFPNVFESWKLVSRDEFSGSSHDLITQEVYVL